MFNLLAQSYDYTYTTTTSSSSGMNPIVSLLYLAILVVLIVAMWKVFEKAGEKGWKSLIPIYSTYIMLKIAGKPGWWLLLLFIPIVNLVALILVDLAMAERFGKSSTFAIFGLFFFSFVGYPMLAFGDAKYTPAPGAAAPKAA